MFAIRKVLLLTALFACILPTTPCLADVPSLTNTGLEDYQLGQLPPAKSRSVGLTHLRLRKKEMAEGETYTVNFLKLFLNGEYLGKAILDDQLRIKEMLIVSPLVGHEAGFGVGTDWHVAARSFPGGEVVYTYVSDRILAHGGKMNPGIQLLFDKSVYKGTKSLRGEWQVIPETDLSPDCKISGVRLYRSEG